MRKEEIQDFLGINIHKSTVAYEIIETYETASFKRQLILYKGSEGDEVRAYLFIPTKTKIKGGVLVHHQHNGERHLGKSEAAGIAGDPFLFFCPALAEIGIIALAPDSICFEDRRKNRKGIEPDTELDDWLQHYNEMCYQLLKGNLLMKKVIDDSSIGISILLQQENINKDKIGILGHSYGGNTVIFHSPFDDRIKYACSSGAVCSYKTKFKHDIGIEMAEVIPGFTTKYDIEDLLKLFAPREFLIVAASLDKYTKNSQDVYSAIKSNFVDSNKNHLIDYKEFQGEHELNQERFDFIINWFEKKFV